MQNLGALFNPQTIAVIGASQDPTKLGYRIVYNIINSGYQGKLFPVNPKTNIILDKACFTDISQLPDDLDVALIVIPAKFVYESLEKLGVKKLKFAVIISSGFAEIGNETEEKRLVEFSKKYGFRILGPNVFGIFSQNASLNATFGPTEIKHGSIGIITQSGAIGISMVGKTQAENIGLSAIISVGNKSDIDETELLQYLGQDPQTKAILMYIEGVSSGSKFVEALKFATGQKPVVIIKSGKSVKGAQAISSHTGSLAGSDQVFEDVIRQCGAIRAEGITQALDWVTFLSKTAKPQGKNTLIITNGGGLGVMAADACEKYAIQLYDDIQVLESAFSKLIPNFGSYKNPVDLTGQAKGSDYQTALDVCLGNQHIDSVLCLACETGVFDVDDFCAACEYGWKIFKTKKPISFSLFGGQKAEDSVIRLRQIGVPINSDVEKSVSLLGSLYSSLGKTTDSTSNPAFDFDESKVKQIIDKAKSENRTFLVAAECREIADILQITVPKSQVAKTCDEAKMIASQIGYPLVLKVVSPDILHKSDAGGVIVNITNEAEIIAGFGNILKNCQSHVPGAQILGIEVAEMVKLDTEIIVGAKTDPSIGPIVMVGMGGIYVEVFKDVSFRSYPTTTSELMAMISELKVSQILSGIRGEKSRDISAVARTLDKIGKLLLKIPEISEIEINPLIVLEDAKGIKALDIRILLA